MNLKLKSMSQLLDLKKLLLEDIKGNEIIKKELLHEINSRALDYEEANIEVPEQTTSLGNNIDKTAKMLNQNALEEHY